MELLSSSIERAPLPNMSTETSKIVSLDRAQAVFGARVFATNKVDLQASEKLDAYPRQPLQGSAEGECCV